MCTFSVDTTVTAPVKRRTMQDCTAVTRGTASFSAYIYYGVPRATVQWYKDNTLIPVDDQKYVTCHKGETVRLQIQRCLPEDAGIYEFRASNEAGNVTSAATLNVQGQKTAKKAEGGIHIAILFTSAQ